MIRKGRVAVEPLVIFVKCVDQACTALLLRHERITEVVRRRECFLDRSYGNPAYEIELRTSRLAEFR